VLGGLKFYRKERIDEFLTVPGSTGGGYAHLPVTQIYNQSSTVLGWSCGNIVGTAGDVASFLWDLLGPDAKVCGCVGGCTVSVYPCMCVRACVRASHTHTHFLSCSARMQGCIFVCIVYSLPSNPTRPLPHFSRSLTPPPHTHTTTTTTPPHHHTTVPCSVFYRSCRRPRSKR